MSQTLRLNFLAISPQDFKFPVWRKKITKNEQINYKDENIYRTRLPTDDEKKEYENFVISFKPKSGYEQFYCSSDTNNQLTLRYLFEILLERTKSTFQPKDYDFKSKFCYEINFYFNELGIGREYISIEPYYLKNQKTFGIVVDFGFRKNKNVPFNREVQKLSLSLDFNYKSNSNYYLDKYNKIIKLFTQVHKKLFPIKIENNLILSINPNFEQLNEINLLDSKMYLFNNQNTQNSQYLGLIEYGPYRTLPKSLQIYIIARKKDRYLIDDINNAFFGKYDNQKSFFEFFKIKVDIIALTNIEDFNSSILKSIEDVFIRIKNENDGSKIIFPIVIIKKNNDEIYNELKMRLLQNGLSVQFITKELINDKDTFKWAIPNLFLQIFCKNGGIPWLVQAKNNDCLIIGIGQSHKREGDRIKKFFSYSVCTESTGLYKKFSILGEHENLKEYLQVFRNNIKKEFQDEIVSYSKIVLHIPFKLNHKETKSLKEEFEQLAIKAGKKDLEIVIFLKLLY